MSGEKGKLVRIRHELVTVIWPCIEANNHWETEGAKVSGAISRETCLSQYGIRNSTVSVTENSGHEGLAVQKLRKSESD